VTEAIGWASSLVLVVTLGNQVRKQWKERTSRGVSRWLFIGQLAASAGFLIYSVGTESWVFVATNAALVINALVGWAIVRRHQRQARA